MLLEVPGPWSEGCLDSWECRLPWCTWLVNGSEVPKSLVEKHGKTRFTWPKCPARGVFGTLGPWVLEDEKSEGGHTWGHTWIQANPLHTDGMSWMRCLQLLEVAGCAKTYESVSKSLLPEMKCEMSAIMRNSLSRSFKAKAFGTPIFAWHNVLICFAVFTYIHVYRFIFELLQMFPVNPPYSPPCPSMHPHLS